MSTAIMTELAIAFLQSLDTHQQQQVVFPFEDAERVNWHYIPRQRQGLPLKAMTAEQRQAGDRLLQFALSDMGYQKAQHIRDLEIVLRELRRSSTVRDPDLYYFSVFGDPATFPWGWRIEGHHLSLNLTFLSETLFTVTPAFFGANPAEVRTMPHQGLRTLAQEQDLAFDLLQSLSSSQRQQVLLAHQTFGDIVAGPGRLQQLGSPAGVSLGELESASRDRALRLFEVYLKNLREELVQPQLQRIQDAGFDQIRFAWAGAFKPGQAHYYRFHGPTVLIEFDNTQNDANHIHTVWRDLQMDFGGDALQAHYAEGGHDHGS